MERMDKRYHRENGNAFLSKKRMTRCSHCIHWVFSFQNGIELFGKCNNDLTINDLRTIHEDDVEGIFTSSNFSCCWFEDKPKVVTGINIERNLLR